MIIMYRPFDTVLFDLDGTLLPMQTDRFIDLYYDGMAIAGEPYGFSRQYLYDVMETAFVAMMHNNGAKTNRELYFDHVRQLAGENFDTVRKVFDRFSEVEFDKIRECTYYNPSAPGWIRGLKEKGYRLVLATNPLFPRECTRRRLTWAGLDPDDFSLITTYEDYSFAKPSLEYYEAVLSDIGKSGEMCLMVGNDVHEDMTARQLGMQVFLLKNNMINARGEDYSAYPQGFYRDFDRVVEELPAAAEYF